MQKSTLNQDVGSSFPLVATVASMVALLIIAASAYLYQALSAEESFRKLVIATGDESGTYHALGKALQRVLERSGAFANVQVLTTDGSVANMGLVAAPDGGVDFAFVQGDSLPGNDARLVAELYDEVLHILISKNRATDIQTIYDLAGKRVALGPADSGTRELSQRVLQHFGIEPGKDLLLSPEETAAGLRDGIIDAAFVLTAIPSRLISGLAGKDAIRFLSLGGVGEAGNESEALALVFPGINVTIIPRSTYVRLPRQPVRSISVSAMLIAHKDLDDELVREVTETLFENRAGKSGLEGSELMVARRIRENYDPAHATMPYHPGAVAFYRREEPPFFVEYAEALSLGLTLMIGMYSVFIAIREWVRRRMKNRVDAYLLDVERLASNLESLPISELIEQRDALTDLRRRAFSDLVSERLLADEAFTILQNHLRDELATIDTAIADKSVE